VPHSCPPPVDLDRIASLDAMRGLAVVIWWLSEVGVPRVYRFPSGYVTDALSAQLSRSFWHGITVRDALLPAFCFIAGGSIAPAFRRRKSAGQTNRDLAWRIARRVVLLFIIGLACDGGVFDYWPHLRFAGAFQRIAVCYAIAAAMELIAGWRLQAGLAAFLLLDYWVILVFGDGASDAGNRFSLAGNVAAAVDQWILPGRKYFGTWDPEGVLTTIPAITVTIVGLLAGKALSADRQARRSLSLWFVGLGTAAVNLGFLCDFVLPINSYLWTPSFCLVGTGAGLIVLGGLHAALDSSIAASATSIVAAPFVTIGRNALVVVLATLALELGIRVPTIRLPLVHKLLPQGSSSLTTGVLIAVAVIATAVWLDKRRVYITV
jgi:predicted acyltransferase